MHGSKQTAQAPVKTESTMQQHGQLDLAGLDDTMDGLECEGYVLVSERNGQFYHVAVLTILTITTSDYVSRVT
ncbi:hypothetical protein BaRGS_00014283 [Batillaria attramentaria]|uniref:Uncharacterized protein n=1 Tax=Batillaria attramentaria TaxID=370345 RepID=A0ABD0L571_9CAEN